ncbi:MAG: hypothetical protein H7123_07070, partial [Thermoleophilia bacterium]|nr:hypothetical protein [Thermoleophilia bacterium]
MSSTVHPDVPGALPAPEEQQASGRREIAGDGAGARRRLWREWAFRLVLYSALAVSLVSLAALLVDVVAKGAPRLNFDILTNFPSSTPAIAGAQSAVVGTIWVVGLTAVICIPLGIGAAVYLEEYADSHRWYNRLIELNIQNL